jgi:iron(III) transport system permease protein
VSRWRLVVASLLLLLVGVPLALPFLELLRHAGAWQPWEETQRLGLLAENTARLVAATLALALPAGIAGAWLLYRTDLPLRGLLRSLTVLALFVPLPLVASAWQAALGTGGWVPVALWTAAGPGDPDISATGTAWKPWPRGMAAAVWVHALAALPWVILLVGQGLCWVERELEEDALLAAGRWRVLRRVTAPRAAASIWAAALWVVLLVATEITVTDLMQVRTFAEEVYTQFIAGGDAALARAVAVSLPFVLLTWTAVLWAVRRWERSLPPLESLARPPLLFALGWARWPCLFVVFAAVGLLAGVPLASLVWKAGLEGSPPSWSALSLWRQIVGALAVHGRLVAESVAVAAAAGAVTALLAVVVCWLALDARRFRAGALGLMAAVWALPGPVIGLGLHQVTLQASRLGPANPIARALWYDPSVLPALWAYLVRFFPCAIAVLWPVVRLIPVELRDSIRVDGARPGQELRYLILPLATPASVRAGLAVMVLALGELSASKLVEPPGAQTFAHKLWEQLHYSTTAHVAALCLVLLGMVLAGGLAWAAAEWLLGRLGRQRSRSSSSASSAYLRQ